MKRLVKIKRKPPCPRACSLRLRPVKRKIEPSDNSAHFFGRKTLNLLQYQRTRKNVETIFNNRELTGKERNTVFICVPGK